MVTDLTNNTDCNITLALQSVSPWHLYQALDNWLFIFYSLVLSLLLVLWISSLVTVHSLSRPSSFPTPQLPRLLYLSTMPAFLSTVTAVPLFLPSTLSLVQLVQDFLTVTAMLTFVYLTVDLLEGAPALVLKANGSSFPLGTPPCCFLRICPNPKITPKIINMIINNIRFLIIVILLKSFISICQVYSGFIPRHGFHLSNLPEFLSIPIFMSCMYSYKAFLSITGDMLPNTWHKLRGHSIFFLFILCKAVGVITGILEAQSVLTCIPPTITPPVFTNLLTATVQFVFSSIVGLIISRIYKTTWKMPAQDTSDHIQEKKESSRSEQMKAFTNNNYTRFIDQHDHVIY